MGMNQKMEIHLGPMELGQESGAEKQYEMLLASLIFGNIEG